MKNSKIMWISKMLKGQQWIVFSFIVLFIVTILTVIIINGSEQKIQAICTIILLIVTGVYAWSAFKTLQVMEHSRLDSFQPIIAIRSLDYRSHKTAVTQMDNTLINRLNIEIDKKRRFGLRLVNIGKGPALNISIWSNLELDNKNKWTGKFSCTVQSLTSNVGKNLGVDNGNPDLQIEFIRLPIPILNDGKLIIIAQYTDMFRRWFITTNVFGLQGLASLSRPLSKDNFNNNELLDLLKKHGSTAKFLNR